MSKLEGLPDLNRRLDAISKATGRDLLREIQINAVAQAKHLVPRRTGNLGRSISPGSLSDTHAIVQATAGYAAYVELGTKPHVIRPKRRKVLAWAASPGGARLSGRARTGAAMRFAKKVNHPGTKAQPYLLPGARFALEKLGIRRIIEKWNRAA
jgi:phage gpG-like protein